MERSLPAEGSFQESYIEPLKHLVASQIVTLADKDLTDLSRLLNQRGNVVAGDVEQPPRFSDNRHMVSTAPAGIYEIVLCKVDQPFTVGASSDWARGSTRSTGQSYQPRT